MERMIISLLSSCMMLMNQVSKRVLVKRNEFSEWKVKRLSINNGVETERISQSSWPFVGTEPQLPLLLSSKARAFNLVGSRIIPQMCCKLSLQYRNQYWAYIRLGYSKKGYTDGKIGRAWIEHFHEQTKDKANGQQHLLLVDGHNSHYMHAFLEFLRAHWIDVVGYLSHSTHIYQGLDVVIFGPLKHNWSLVHHSWEQRGHTVNKTNFLAVYAEAHTKTLTLENIKAAFCKTGVIPFNPDVVTKEMMALSLVTSTRNIVPVQQSSPI